MRSKTAISVLVLVVLALHAIPVLSYQGVRQTRWPFLTWAMYARSYPPGPIDLVMRELIATAPDGRRREVNYWDVGLSSPAFQNNYLAPFSRGDSAAARSLVERLNRIGPDSVAELRLVVVRHRLIEAGVAVDTLPSMVFAVRPVAGR